MREKELDFICLLLGGSHLYGINGPNSDEDMRGVYITDSLPSVFELERDENVTGAGEQDYAYFEAARFIQLLKKTNTNSLELLFAPDDAFLILRDDFKYIRRYSDSLVDSGKLLASLKGYAHNEIRLALGERTGRLGGKRKTALEEFGYSYKNVANLICLVHQVGTFLQTGEFKVRLEGEIKELCLSIKTVPQDWPLDKIIPIVEDCREKVESVEDKINRQFDNKIAGNILWEIYCKKFG